MTSANREQEKDGVSGLEEALARWREDECPYHHEHGPWCDDAEKFAAEVRRYQAQATAVEALMRSIEEYQSEWENPAKDYSLRATRRQQMFAALASVRGGSK